MTQQWSWHRQAGRPRAGRSGVVALLLPALLLLGACQAPEPPPAGPAQGDMPPPAVDVAPAVERPVRERETLVGRLVAPDQVDVRARVDGHIEAVHFEEGDEVEQGQLLFTLDARPFQARLDRAGAELAAARSRLALAELELKRARELLDKRLGSRQEYDQRTAELRFAEQQVLSAEAAVRSARLDLDYTRIRAPIDGRISDLQVTPGNLVRFGEPVLTRIVSEQQVQAYFDVSEQVFLSMFGARSGPRARRPQVRMGLENEQGFPHTGQIDFIDNRLDPATATMRVRAVFDNADRRFTPGLVARIRLLSEQASERVLTPERAIGTDQDQKYVLVVDEAGVVQFRPIRLGPLLEGMRVVSEGLAAGERVVVSGLQRARPGSTVTPRELPLDAEGLPLAPAAGAQPGAPPS